MNLQLAYVVAADRLCLTVRYPDAQVSWWLTRRLTLQWVTGWLEKLGAVALPELPLPGLALPRDLAMEHGLSLEVDGPQPGGPPPPPPEQVGMLEAVTMQVTALSSVLRLSGSGRSVQGELTRKDSHAVIELLARQCRQAGWLDRPDWPPWLGGGS
jgi:hypothetical protein